MNIIESTLGWYIERLTFLDNGCMITSRVGAGWYIEPTSICSKEKEVGLTETEDETGDGGGG